MNKLFSSQHILKTIIIFAIICFVLAMVLDIKLLALVPFMIPFAFITIVDFKKVYLLLFASIPISIEYYLPNGFGTDLPTEPLMLLLTGIGIILFLHQFHLIRKSYLLHPITIALLLHISWIFISAITSVNQVISFKFFLAKLWYVIPFYGMSLYFFKDKDLVYNITKPLVVVFTLLLIVVNIRHSQHGFSFAMINKSLEPIFRNHVNYAALLAITIPFVWALYLKTRKRYYIPIMLLILFSVYFSYTRAAYVVVMMLPFVYLVVRWRLLKWSVWIGVISIPFIVNFFVADNNYLNYAPDYNKTIMNYEFDDLLAATYKMEDLSTMERVYRWVAGGHMINDHMLMGFGPSTFYTNYKAYVVSGFKTYVSDNPDKSGIHNYFLMTTVEQGIIGFMILLILFVVTFLIAAKVYNVATDVHDKQVIMASIMSLVSITAILLINDMLESDKLGPFFFLNLAIITHYSIKYKCYLFNTSHKNLK